MQTQANIEAFIQFSQLTSSSMQALMSKIRVARDSNDKTTYNAIELACLTAQAALETESVETTSVNQIKIDLN